MNIRLRNPIDWSEEYSIEDIKNKLSQLIESNLYIYPKKPISKIKYAAIIEPNQSEFKGGKTPIFFKDIEEAFNEVTVLIGTCKKEGRTIINFRIYDVLWYEGEDLTKTSFINRISYIDKAVSKINNSLVKGAEYLEITENFYNTMSKFFSLGGENMIIFNKYEPYQISEYAMKIIDKRLLSTYEGKVIDYIESEKNKVPNKLDTWKYWINRRTGEKLLGEYFKDYIYDNLILEPISEDYYYNRPNGVIIELFDGRKVKLSNKKLKKGDIIKIGCVDFNNIIYQPYLMED